MNTGGQILTLLLAAGQTLQSTVAGTQFYVVATPGVVQINAGNGFSPYYQGTGSYTGQQFNLLQITNPANVRVVVQIYVGFSDFIDHREIPLGPGQVNVPVTNPLIKVNGGGGQPNPSFANFQDKSGQFVQSAADGLDYFLVQRLLLIITNFSIDQNGNPVAVWLQSGNYSAANSPMAAIPSIAAAAGSLPIVPFQLNMKGTFSLSFFPPGLVANGLFAVAVSEIYQGIPALV